MLTEPFTGLSLPQLANLEIDKPIALPNKPELSIVAVEEAKVSEYETIYKDGMGIKLPMIPHIIFIMYKPQLEPELEQA